MLNTIGVFVFVLFFSISCTQKDRNTQFLAENKKKWEEKILKNGFPTDSIVFLLDESVVLNDNVAISVLCKELGQRMRQSSDFSKAITYHQQGLAAAYEINDTIGITQALNNLGTDFRRIGALPEASDYHYQALQIAEAYSGRYDSIGRKNRVMAINGVGNINLSFGNYGEAEKNFREALIEEKALQSSLGQAMNYANLGAVYEERKMYDSAFVYYERSMEQNILAKSQLGIGLCYIHLGDIYEIQKDYDKAEQSYQMAYGVMGNISDTWHWLEAALAIARMRLLKNDFVESKKYIDRAKEAAIDIKSPEHLAHIYNLLHEYNLRQGNYAAALNDFKLSNSYKDSIQNVQKINRVVDMRLKYEHDKNQDFIAQLNVRHEMETRQKKIILYASILIVFLLVLLLASLFYAYVHRTKKNKILRNLNRMRENFFTNITHEFRTPLTVILGLNNFMRDQKNLTQSEVNSYMKAIDRQGNHLLTLVNQLLNIAKINSGQAKPEWRKGNIVVYIKMIVDSFDLYAKSKDIKLSLVSSEPLIEMDFVPYYMDEIMQNLLSNAIKYNSSGGKVSVIVSKNSNKEAVIKVVDNGDGISEENIEHIFDLFYQGANFNTNTSSGIGLNYTRQLIDVMHGKISVESELKKGSVFSVFLPLKANDTQVLQSWSQLDEKKSYFPENSENQEKTPIESHSKDLSAFSGSESVRKTILLVEDSEDVLLYIKALLPPEYNLVSASDGVEGLKIANELVPDIIVSDVMMPNKDGLSLSCDIRASELLNHIPIILLTAKTTMDDQLQGLKSGADAYIRKPFHPDELLIQIQTLLESRRLLKEKYMRSILKGEVLEAKDTNMDFLQKATDIIYQEMKNPEFSSVHLASKLCLSSSQLNRKLTAVSGYPPSLYITRLRIDRAKKKLASENKSIGQIAAECGFYDTAYFSRIFKKYTEVTPSQYQRLPKDK